MEERDGLPTKRDVVTCILRVYGAAWLINTVVPELVNFLTRPLHQAVYTLLPLGTSTFRGALSLGPVNLDSSVLTTGISMILALAVIVMGRLIAGELVGDVGYEGREPFTRRDLLPLGVTCFGFFVFIGGSDCLARRIVIQLMALPFSHALSAPYLGMIGLQCVAGLGLAFLPRSRGFFKTAQ